MKHIVVDLEMNEISKKYREKKAICKMEIIEIMTPKTFSATLDDLFNFDELFEALA